MSQTALVRLSEDSDRTKRACARLATLSRTMEAAVKRALPYLVRRKVPVVALPPKPGLYDELIEALPGPRHLTSVRVGTRLLGALVLDGPAVARALDGVLGGNGELATLDPSGLSPAQTALASRVAQGLVIAFAEVLARIGVRIEAAPEGKPAGALFVTATLRVGEGDDAGHIVILMPASVLDVGKTPEIEAPDQPLTRAAVAEAEVDLVAELARVPLAMSKLASMRVGDVLRLPIPVNAPVCLRVGGRTLHTGRPINVGAQIAIAIERHAD